MSDPSEDSSPDREWLHAPIDWRWVWLDWLSSHGGMTFAAVILLVTVAFLTDVWLGPGITAALSVFVVVTVLIVRKSKQEKGQKETPPANREGALATRPRYPYHRQ